MKRLVFILILFCVYLNSQSYAQKIKAVIYDFDGLNIGQDSLPDGDYKTNDLAFHVVTTPLVNSEVLGDRSLELDLNWAAGKGEFGKGLSRFYDLNVSQDHLSFYFYNPVANSADAKVELILTEDDNSNNIFEYSSDDEWVDTISIPRQVGWQLLSVPLNNFIDQNAGGNGIFDVGFAGTGSMLFTIGFNFLQTDSSSSAQYFIDMISLTEGSMPHGTGILDLPVKNPSDYCLLGALENNDFPDATPDSINALFPDNKLKYVNWFVDYAKTGTIANHFTGPEVTNLLNKGYVPVITWEMMYESYPRLDPVQPNLDQILNGSFDSYIDDFADQIGSYRKTVILRIFHEFEGNWYPWSLTENSADSAKYIAAWRYVVDRFRSRGTLNVQWMWCVNAEPKPYVDYNFIVNAYPGDEYVDIVATDIYNHPNPGVPDWKSFRYTLSETYYYLTKYFPQKPMFICEVASRERYAGEPGSSQTKAEWTCSMSRDLQSYFSNVRALIFFSTVKEHDWRLNSSDSALEAASDCIWNDPYFQAPVSPIAPEELSSFNVYPNPFITSFNIDVDKYILQPITFKVSIYDVRGRKTLESGFVGIHQLIEVPNSVSAGVYILELNDGQSIRKFKLVKTNN